MFKTKSEEKTDRKQPTLSMVAKESGVSPSTVSRILNSTARVSEKKRQRVLQIIQQLNFRPNLVARSLVSGKTMTIGVLTQFVDSPFYSEALRGVEEALSNAQYAPLFVSGHWNEQEELSKIDLLQTRKVDGIIIFTGMLRDESLLKIAQSVPVVVTGRKLQEKRLTSIDFDNTEGTRLIVQHLDRLNHRNIAYISGPTDHSDAMQRLEGIQKYAREMSMMLPKELIIFSNYLESGGYHATQQLLSKNIAFTALIAANDQMAYGANLALARASLRVPDDVSLVGYDDLPHSAFINPPLTTIRQSVFEIGQNAAKAMLTLLRGETVESTTIVPKLVIRESTRHNTALKV